MSKCVKNIIDTLGFALSASFLFSPHFGIINFVIYYWQIDFVGWCIWKQQGKLWLSLTIINNNL